MLSGEASACCPLAAGYDPVADLSRVHELASHLFTLQHDVYPCVVATIGGSVMDFMHVVQPYSRSSIGALHQLGAGSFMLCISMPYNST